MTFAIAEALI
ncbi:Protein of unknown function [Bacillus cereus]|nr:Protein of unknown function [Bacillus cereus]